jgi:hypothetical protein
LVLARSANDLRKRSLCTFTMGIGMSITDS